MNLMSREDPQFYNIYEQPWRGASGEHEILHGLDARLLSKNRRTGASTWMARLPAGWRTSIKADQDTVETFVLEGDLSVNDRKIGSTGFAGIPQWAGPVRLASDGGAAVYFFITPDLPLPAYTSGIKVTDLWNEPWQMIDMTGVRHGIMFKSLRTPDPAQGALHGGAGGFLRMTLCTPGFMEPRHEIHHNCWEEILILRGDLFMKDRGLHVGGTYLGNPAHLWHYPSASQGGCLLLIQCDAPMDVEFRDYQGGYESLCGYMQSASWIDEPKHTPSEDPVELQYSYGGTAFGMESEPTPPGPSPNGLSGAPRPTVLPSTSGEPTPGVERTS
jgi:hypothetical protein